MDYHISSRIQNVTHLQTFDGVLTKRDTRGVLVKGCEFGMLTVFFSTPEGNRGYNVEHQEQQYFVIRCYEAEDTKAIRAWSSPFENT